MDFGLTQSSLKHMHKSCAFEEAIFQTKPNWNMKINSEILLGHSHHLLPLLKIFPASKAKPIYIANASIFPSPSPNSKQQRPSGVKKVGIFAGNLETLSS